MLDAYTVAEKINELLETLTIYAKEGIICEAQASGDDLILFYCDGGTWETVYESSEDLEGLECMPDQLIVNLSEIIEYV